MEKQEIREKELYYTKQGGKATMVFCLVIGIIFFFGWLFKFMTVPALLPILTVVTFFFGLFIYYLCKRNIYSPLLPYLVTTFTALILSYCLGFVNPQIRNLFFIIYFYIVLHPAYYLGIKNGLYAVALIDIAYAIMTLTTTQTYPTLNIGLEFSKLILFTVITFIIMIDFEKNLLRLRALRGLLTKAEKGDLTVRYTPKDEHDEIHFLGISINNLFETELKIVSVIQALAQNLSRISTQIATTAREISTGISDIVATTQKMTDGVDQQYRELEQSINAGKMLSEINFEVVNNIKKIENNSVEFSTNLTTALNKSDLIIKNIEIISNRYENLISLMAKLNDISNAISTIIATINSISEKINILALNASIEAARAGEYGRGFSIVADEVKKLADSTQNSATEIDKIIKEMTESVKTVAQSSEEVMKAIKEGNQVVKSTTESLKSISGGIIELSNAIKEIKNIIAREEAEIGGIIRQIESSYNISKENSIAAEQILSSMEEQSAATEEFSNTSQELVSIINKLNEITKNFKT
ncbi:MAG: methyl-accepting chemotaxis protein [candidate division WOR-3 bacterium]